MQEQIESLNDRIIGCRNCPRLVAWREEIAEVKRKSFQNWTYWGKPVPNFGDPNATHLIVGLAPAAHGANRTGRMFTGDNSGLWLYRALERAGVANRGHSDDINDGLQLKGVMITAICHCAPPDNKPTNDEIRNCNPFLSELLSSRTWSGILCLGSLAWIEVHKALGARAPKFSHGTSSDLSCRLTASYHPSQQNTFTKKLTEPMLDAVIASWQEVQDR